MPTMNKGLRKLIHKKYDTITINECNTSKKCCDCYKDLEYYKDKENKKVFRLLVCSNCVSCENKKNRIQDKRCKFLNKYFEINEMLDRETNKTNRISKSYFVFHFFTNQREEEKVRPSILILHFCIFFNAKVGVLNVQRCKETISI